MDGASHWQIFRNITWPAILPVSATIVLIRLIEGFKIVDMPNILTGGGPGHGHAVADPPGLSRLAHDRPRAIGGDRLHPALPGDHHRHRVRRLGARPDPSELMANPLRRRSPSTSRRQPRSSSYVLLVVWAFVVLFPLYWLAITSFKLPIDVDRGPFYFPFIDFQPTLDAWHNILVELGNDTLRPYVNTVVVGLSSALLALMLGSSAAYALVRFTYRPQARAHRARASCCVAGSVRWPCSAASRGNSRSGRALAVFALLAQAVGAALPADAGQQRHRVLADLAADLAADRGRHPAVRAVPAGRPARHAARPDPDLRRDQPADRRLADARLLHGPAHRTGGVRPRSTARRSTGSSARSCCRSPCRASWRRSSSC